MSTNAQQHSSRVGGLPPLVYFAVGIVCLAGWFLGTLVQVQTSESWIASGVPTAQTSATVMAQVLEMLHGTLPESLTVPFWFAWGVQLALIVASAGLEMPKYPVWRHRAAWAVILLLIGVNSAGDWTYSAAFGGWGQLGFTVTVLFVTFVLGLLATMAFVHGWRAMTATNS